MVLDDYLNLPYNRLVQEINDENGHCFTAIFWILAAVKARATHWRSFTLD